MIDINVAKIKLPTIYCTKCVCSVSKLMLSKSSINGWSAGMINDPIFNDPNTINGIKGGILMFDPKKDKDLFHLKTVDKKIDRNVCPPHTGTIPIKTPNAIESAFISLESFVCKTSSFINCLKLFFLKDRKSTRL